MLIVNYDNEESSDIPTVYGEPAVRNYSPDEEHIRLLGRGYYNSGKMYLSYSGSGIEFICKGSYAEITVCRASDNYVNRNHRPRFAIYSDGNLIVDECVDFEEKTYRIDTDYEGTTITLIKLSEAMYSSFAVGNISSYGTEGIVPSPEKKLNIEFIGDSITCGYGVDAGRFGTFSTQTENFTKTYAFNTAMNLDAQWSAVCFSGYGVVSGYTENGYKTDKLVMNEYDKACTLTDADYTWDFSKTETDLVVVNLGTNDASYCSESYSRRFEFVDAYINLLKTVREKNESAYILCILGDMNNSLFSSLESAVEQYKAQTGDERAEAFTISYDMGKNDVVIDGHPGEKSNLRASESLTDKIRNLILWGRVG